MDRRDFLKTAGAALAVVAAPVLASDPKAQGLTLEALSGASEMLRTSSVDGSYWLFLHPSQLKDIEDIAAREEWRECYREARRLGKAKGKSPQYILAEFKPKHPKVEQGQYEGIRFVTSNGPHAAQPIVSFAHA